MTGSSSTSGTIAQRFKLWEPFVIRKLTIWQKAALCSITLCIPIALLTFYFIKTSNKDVNFARKELCGNQYNQQVRTLLERVQQRRELLAHSPASAALPAAQLSRLDNQIDNLFGNLSTLQNKICVDGTYGAELATTQMLAELTQYWQNLKNNASVSDEGHKQFEERILAFYLHVADASNLILDPELDTYHMIDATVAQFPKATQHLDKLLSDAWPSVVAKSITPDEKLNLAGTISELEKSLNQTLTEVQSVYNEDHYYSGRRDTLRQTADDGLQHYVTAVRHFITLLHQRVIGGGLIQGSSIDLTPEEFATAGSTALESLYRFSDHAAEWENQALTARAAHYNSERNRVLLIVALVVLFSAVLTGLVVRSITRPLNEAILDLTTASKEILATTTEQASGAREQAAAVAETAATVDEITQTAQQAAQRANTLGEAARRTAEVGEAGKKAVDGSIAAMRAVREQVETTAQNILSLAEQALAIGEIIATVNDIAEETNLLALNAAIEASRAGEHGKGFAVVASEIKQLANQSKQATVQVRQILGEIQKATNAAVVSTENVTRAMTDVTQVSSKAGETIGALAETLAETMRAAAQIAASAGQQATGTAQIAIAIKNIDQVTQQTISATSQSKEAAANLNVIGNQIASLIG
jgi:methyl-accepting chemotaxis protein